MGYISAGCFLAMILCAVAKEPKSALIFCALGFLTGAIGWIMGAIN